MKFMQFEWFKDLSKVGVTTCIVMSVVGSTPAWSQSATVDSGLKQPIIRYNSIHHPVKGRYGMVVSQNSIATRIACGGEVGDTILPSFT